MSAAHTPVLLREVLDSLVTDPDGVYVDMTFGRGGHSRALLTELGSRARLVAIDRDPQAAKAARELGSNDRRFEFIQGEFSMLRQLMDERSYSGEVRGILADLGVSSPQLDEGERGFSFRLDGPLDMRMNPTQGVTAAEWLRTVDEQDLTDVLREYGEERQAKRIARAIVRRRATRPFTGTSDLAEFIAALLPQREQRKHPATRSFQAIRMAVNNETDEIEQGIGAAAEVLAPSGRIAVISFHSVEDRLVKRTLRAIGRGASVPSRLPVPEDHAPVFRSLGKAIRPSAAEVTNNRRARSAVLRVAEKVA